MELFSKVYNCYYQVVGRILSECTKKPITEKRMHELCEEYGFGESDLYIIPKLVSGQWSLLKNVKDRCYRSKLDKIEKIPLTLVQKAWLKALLLDARIRLFIDEELLDIMEQCLDEIEPLFRQEDFYYFDRYENGDSYDSLTYRHNFKNILKAFQTKSSLRILYENKKGGETSIQCAPYEILYSEKEDRFRLEAVKIKNNQFCEGITLNLGRMKSCEILKENLDMEIPIEKIIEKRQASEPVQIEISGERNSLERCMLHFASYKKKTEYDEQNNRYLCSVYYDKLDETELLIQILSFGPVIRVLGPKPFLEQVKARVKNQYELFHMELS